MFSITIANFQCLFFILIIYLFNGYKCDVPTTDIGLPTSSSPKSNCVNSNGVSGCHCPSGWTGRNCTQDIDECTIQPKICNDGICLNKEGSYKCFCAVGKSGIHCDLDVNYCWSHPCQNGATCHSKFDSYTCKCDAGFEGTHCEINIDECERYNPCGDHGTCIDRRNNYDCNCDENFGGKNCTVALSGCSTAPCLNDGICKPYLVNETDHLFNCSCQHGYRGDTCEETTTISMFASSLITVKTQRKDGYAINLQFRTPFPNGTLAFGQSAQHGYKMELINGRLNLHSTLLNKWRGVFIGSEMNDGYWHKIVVAFNKTHLVLSANDEKAIYPVGNVDVNQPSFPWTYIGGTIPNILRSYIRHLTHRPENFVGCMQDIVVNDKWIFPDDNNYDQYTELKNVQSGCLHTEQCQPNTCHPNGGFCNSYFFRGTSGLERRFNCTCLDGFRGDTCEETTAISMTDNSLITVKTQNTDGYAISLQFRTIFPNGTLAFGTTDDQNESDGYKLELVDGSLNLHTTLLNEWNGVFIGTNLNNSKWHKVFVAINTTHLVFTVDEEQTILPFASNERKPSFPLTYLGGTIPQLYKSYLRYLVRKPLGFIGCMQDIVVNDKWIFPQENNNDQDMDFKNVENGCLRTKQCLSDPCNSNGECTDLWHTFSCTCKRPYFGHTCKKKFERL